MANPNSIFSATAVDQSRNGALTLLATALVICAIAYIPGLSGPLFLDDLPQLNGLIEHSSDDPGALLDDHIMSNSGPFGRPVAMATFVGSAVAHGSDTWWWKFDNLLIHLITGLLVFWLAVLLFSAADKPRQERYWLVAGGVATLWLLHPLHVSSVLYAVQRMTELSTLFVFAGLISYATGRQRQIAGGTNGWFFIGLGFGVFFPLAVLSKESALLFPVFCSLIEFLVFRFNGQSGENRSIKVFHVALLSAYVAAAIYLVINFTNIVTTSYAIRDFTLSERIYTELRIVAQYLSQLLLPVQNKMGFFHDDISLSTSLFSPISTLFSALFLFALLASAVFLRKRLPLYAFGVLFFFAGHLLESTIFSLELMYEHRNYLPSFGIVIAAVAGIQAVVSNQRGIILIGTIAIIGFALLTWQRALTWGSADTMYPYMYRVHPQSRRLTYIFVDSYTRRGDYESARETLATMAPGIGPETHKLFLSCLEYGELQKSEILKVLALTEGRLDGHATTSIDDLVLATLEGKCRVPNEMLISVADHLLKFPAKSFLHTQSILFAKARVFDSMNETDAALDALRLAYELQPNNARSLYFSAHTLSTAGRLDEAAEALTVAYEVERTSKIHNKGIAKTVYLNVGNMYLSENELEKALAIYSEGILAIPTEPLFYIKQADLLIQLLRIDGARQSLLKLRSLEPDSISEYEQEIRGLEAYVRDRANSAGS